jgi:hypothetical protein
MVDFASWKEQAAPDEVRVPVCFNRTLLREYHQAKDELERIKGSGDEEALREVLDKITEMGRLVEEDEREHTFTFVTVDWNVWAEAAEGHEPTKQQREADKYAEFDPETFPPVAIAVACKDPELTVEDAEWLRQKLPRNEFWRLFNAAMQANVGGSSIPLSERVIVDQLATELKSITRPNEASP